jgi:hypothetical protein
MPLGGKKGVSLQLLPSKGIDLETLQSPITRNQGEWQKEQLK